MFTRLPLIAVLGGLLYGCSTYSTKVAATETALLSSDVRGSQPLPVDAFNNQIAAAVLRGETWPKEPSQVAFKFAAPNLSQVGAATWQGAGEHPSRYQFIVIVDNLPDDSIRGRRLTFALGRRSDDSWQVVDAQLSWRCWRKAGDASFGVDPCP